ncbi:hypothetical protein CH352_18745 [Leptospira hartskeerlii]|nr:hypothetical protein CH352_18745 [Leptospira hartskeerlii]
MWRSPSERVAKQAPSGAEAPEVKRRDCTDNNSVPNLPSTSNKIQYGLIVDVYRIPSVSFAHFNLLLQKWLEH